jgi:hypothetical protein
MEKRGRRAQPKKIVPTEKAPEVEALAADLIERYHPGLKSAVVKYGFTARKGKAWGKVVLVREEAQTLMERKISFLVIVNKAHWDRSDESRREAALDELLCSMSYDGMQPRIEKPDFKGYRANILRFGPRTDEMERAFRGCQLILPGVDEIEAELAPAPPCDDCGDPADKDMIHEGKSLCPVCYKWRQDSADPGRSNADDEGAHCEGCNSWGRAGRLEEMDGRMLCWKCREAADEQAAADADVSVTITADGKSVETTVGALDQLANMTPEELADLPGVDFTQHAAEVA